MPSADLWVPLKDGVITYSLCPLSGERWNTLQNEIVHYKKEPRVVHGGANSNVSEAGDPISEINSVDKFVSDSVSSRSQGIILPLDREVRIKLYMGQVRQPPFFQITQLLTSAGRVSGFFGLVLDYTSLSHSRIGIDHQDSSSAR